MKKILLFISLIITASIFFACNKQKTAQELLKEEKKAIERFIAKRGFEIVTKDTLRMLEDNVYFKTKEGLYINVIDSGNGNKVKTDNQEILVRYEYSINFKIDTARTTGNILAQSSAYILHYRVPPYQSEYEGLAIGLRFVSENARVNLIIPSALQPYSSQGDFRPMFLGNLIYRFK